MYLLEVIHLLTCLPCSDTGTLLRVQMIPRIGLSDSDPSTEDPEHMPLPFPLEYQEAVCHISTKSQDLRD